MTDAISYSESRKSRKPELLKYERYLSYQDAGELPIRHKMSQGEIAADFVCRHLAVKRARREMMPEIEATNRTSMKENDDLIDGSLDDDTFSFSSKVRVFAWSTIIIGGLSLCLLAYATIYRDQHIGAASAFLVVIFIYLLGRWGFNAKSELSRSNR
jgi:hypothetical protein